MYEDDAARLLARLREQVPQIQASLLASVDGLFLADDGDRLPGPQTAALTSALSALAAQAVAMTGCGRLLDASIRGSDGYLMVFAVGQTAVLAVAAGPEVSPAWVHLHSRDVVAELATFADRFEHFGGSPAKPSVERAVPRAVPRERSPRSKAPRSG
jgi:predicted regulator of Ras-like GTPase activity (Roadblock/LC7/MglB family)